MSLIHIRVPSKTKLGFAAVYTLMGLALLGATFILGKNLGWEHVLHRAGYCNGQAAWNICVHKVVESSGAPPGSNVTCSKTRNSKGEYLCSIEAGFAGCYWATVTRSSEGFPLLDTVAQRNKC